MHLAILRRVMFSELCIWDLQGNGEDKLTFLTGALSRWLSHLAGPPDPLEESSAKFKGKSRGWGWTRSSSHSEEPQSFSRTPDPESQSASF